MTDPNFILLYVDHPGRSADFYADLLGHPPVEASPTFAMFALSSGVMLGLWSKDTVAPHANAPGGSEIAFALASNDAVTAAYVDWTRRGLSILQAPIQMDFGYTFVAADPDGHRLRAFAPTAG